MSVNNFGLFFTRDGTVIRLPVNPEKLPVARDTENGDYNVLGIGQIMVPRTPSLKEVTISSFFPGRPFSGVLTSGGFQPPEFYIQFFEAAMNDKAPILYTPVRYYENGETGEFYYDLTLTEYRDYTPGAIQVQSRGGGTPAVATTEPSRDIPQGQLVVGTTCIANGPYYYTSYGDEPHGNGNGRTVVVSRIVDAARAYPIHVTTESGGALGWMKKEALQVVSNT